MRLSTSMIYQSGLNGILNSQSSLLGLQQQVSSGRRVVTPSDDPLAAGQSITVSQNLAMTKAYASNRVVAERALGVEDNALQAVISNLTGVFERIVQAGDGTLSDPDRRMLASVIGNSRDALFALANTTDGNGQYLFSGYQGGTPAYSVDATGAISYTGDSGQRVVQVDQAREMASTDVGTDIFSRATPGTNTYFIAAGANTGTATYGGPATSGTAAQPGISLSPARNIHCRRGPAARRERAPCLGPWVTIRQDRLQSDCSIRQLFKSAHHVAVHRAEAPAPVIQGLRIPWAFIAPITALRCRAQQRYRHASPA